MNDTAICVEGLSKQFHIGRRQDNNPTLRDRLAAGLVSPFRRVRQLMSGNAFGAAALDETIWALEDVSFQIKQGETVGLIGRNGAGKSTLLKILSRITEPTRGYGDIYGRVGSLLEVGTGFHPELTGRDNIYLNGAILGMRRAEIQRKFDEIVAFSEIEKFIDTPVKHYSSGMYLRLAFAVAAHLETEIMLVDEVLAVGDAGFQRKCMGKMGEVAKQGRTVLFVSHNIGAITRLCERSIWLDNGNIKMDGTSMSVVAAYLPSAAEGCAAWQNLEPPDRDDVQVTSARLLLAGQEATTVDFRSDFEVEIGYTLNRKARHLAVLCRMTDVQGNVVWTSWDTDTTLWRGRLRDPGTYLSTCKIPAGLLRPGRYSVSVGSIGAGYLTRGHSYYEAVLCFEVSPVGYPLNQDRMGIVTPLLDWDVAQVGAEMNSELAADAVSGATPPGK
jgi:lipopolysaccharide transport system ATP-binding protein